MLIMLFASGCGLREREEALLKKEKDLFEREQQLVLKEKALDLREGELLKPGLQTDSLPPDSNRVVNQQLVGQWKVKMTCTETSCTGSALGDSQTQLWDFSYQDNNIIVKALTDEKLDRVYAGSYNGKEIRLMNDVDDALPKAATRIFVRLSLTKGNEMEGQREIIRPDCKIVYKLELSKQK